MCFSELNHVYFLIFFNPESHGILCQYFFMKCYCLRLSCLSIFMNTKATYCHVYSCSELCTYHPTLHQACIPAEQSSCGVKFSWRRFLSLSANQTLLGEWWLSGRKGEGARDSWNLRLPFLSAAASPFGGSVERPRAPRLHGPRANEPGGSGRADLKSQRVIKKGSHQLARPILCIQAPLSNVLMICQSQIVK